MNEFIANVLRDAPPTKTKHDEKYLAIALGYPVGWHIVRAQDKTDIIYAGDPRKDADCWFNHDAARQVASQWDDQKSTPYDANGGHLLPKQAKYRKGDEVQVRYKKQWYRATIIKRQKHAQDFIYTVHYTDDDSTQANVKERMIRLAPPDLSAELFATSIGLPQGWKATLHGKRYTIISPNEQYFRTKKAAMDYIAAIEDAAGDPPWRTSDHEFLGLLVTYTSQHKPSARRTIDVVQTGQVTGWISETDVDRQGEPGYVSERTGKPALLFHVIFKDDPGHPYAKHLLDSIDLEEEEVLEMLIDEPPQKKQKQNSLEPGQDLVHAGGCKKCF